MVYRGETVLKRVYKARFPLDSVESWFYARQIINQTRLTEHKASIHRTGVITPLMFRKLEDGTLQGLSGYLRSLACASLGISEVPAFIYSKMDDLDALEVALVDNVQHQELTDWDTANMLNMFRIDGELIPLQEIATRVQKSTSWISQKLAVLSDSLPIQTAVEDGTLTESQARSVRRLPESLHENVIAEVSGKTVKETAETVSKMEETEKEAVITAEIEVLRERLTEIDNAEDTKVKLVSQTSKLEGQLKASKIENKEINTIMRTVETLEKDYFPTLSELEEMRAELKETKKLLPDYPIEDLNGDLKELDTEIAQFDSKIAKLNTKLKALKTERDKVKKSRKTCMSKISEFNERKRKVRDLTEIIQRVAKKEASMRAKLGDNINQLESLKAKLNEHETDTLNKRLELSQQIANLKGQVASLTGKINNRSNLEKKIRALNLELDAIQGETVIEAPTVEA